MAFITNHIIGDKQKETQPEVANNPISANNPINSSGLEKVELEFLLKVLGEANLKGKEVEMFYNLVIKLQQQYINKQ